jgi:GT2 family glycosyltransferase
MKRANIAFIIVAYHPDMEILHQLLSHISGLTIVVDNGQTLTKQDVPSALLITLPTNIGYGAAANIGIRYAESQKATWVIVVNQDLIVTKKGIDELYSAIALCPPGVYGPISGGLDGKRWTSVLPSKNIEYISGSCMVVHTDVIRKIGYLYEPYFMYYEDVDFCKRAQINGFPVKKIPIDGIQHKESVSLGQGSKIHEYYLARNHLLFVQRNAPPTVKLFEYMRLAKTLYEYMSHKNGGALAGLRDYFLQKFGHMP